MSTTDRRDTRPTLSTGAITLERRSIDYVPLRERRGKVWHQGPFWFTGNFVFLTMVVGFIGPSLGLGVGWSILAVALGAAFGTFFMAFHANQGPRMGLPQMIQSRAQFGLRGAIIPFVATIFVYIGFTVFGTVLITQVIQMLLPGSKFFWYPVVIGVAILIAIVGYDLLHFVQRWLTYILIASFGVLTVVAAVTLPATTAPAVVPDTWQTGRVPRPALPRGRLQHQLRRLRLRLFALSPGGFLRAQAHRLDVSRCRGVRDLAHVSRSALGRVPAADRCRVRAAHRWRPRLPRLRARDRRDRRDRAAHGDRGQLLRNDAHRHHGDRRLRARAPDSASACRGARRGGSGVHGDRPGAARRIPGELQRLRPAHALLPRALDSGQPGRLLPRPPRALRDHRHLRSARRLRHVGLARHPRLCPRVPRDGAVLRAALLHRPDRRATGRGGHLLRAGLIVGGGVYALLARSIDRDREAAAVARSEAELAVIEEDLA